MDNETLLESISQHMDQLSSFHGWMLATAISAIYMIVKRRDELEVVGIKLTKEDTSIALSALFLLAAGGIFIVLVRLYRLLEMLPDDQISAAFTRMATHSWLLNPFAYFGDSIVYRFISLLSLLGLVIAWWIGLASLSLLSGKLQRVEYAFVSTFVAVSGLTLITVQQIYFLLIDRMKQVSPELAAGLESVKDSRLSLITWASVIALIISLAVIGMIDEGRKAKDRKTT